MTASGGPGAELSRCNRRRRRVLGIIFVRGIVTSRKLHEETVDTTTTSRIVLRGVFRKRVLSTPRSINICCNCDVNIIISIASPIVASPRVVSSSMKLEKLPSLCIGGGVAPLDVGDALYLVVTVPIESGVPVSSRIILCRSRPNIIAKLVRLFLRFLSAKPSFFLPRTFSKPASFSKKKGPKIISRDF